MRSISSRLLVTIKIGFFEYGSLPLRIFLKMSESDIDDVIFQTIRFPDNWNRPAGTRIGDEDYLGESSIDECIDDSREKKKKKQRRKKGKKTKAQKNPATVHENKKENNKKKKILKDDISDVEEART